MFSLILQEHKKKGLIIEKITLDALKHERTLSVYGVRDSKSLHITILIEVMVFDPVYRHICLIEDTYNS